MYKILFTDIDGTLTDKDGKIPQENIEIIKKLRDNGIKVVLCTGRNIKKTLPVVKKLNITEPIICIDGILLYDLNKNAITDDLYIDKEKARKIIDIARKHKVFTEISNGHLYVKYLDSKNQRELDFFNKHTLWGYIKSYFGGIRYVNSYDKLENIEGNIYQITMGCKKPQFDIISDEINKFGFDDVEVRNNLWPNYIFVNRKSIDKARGIEIICNRYNIDLKDAVSIGDDLNDKGMLDICGLSFAMGNANEDVKKFAKEITDSNDNHGFVNAIKKAFDI